MHYSCSYCTTFFFLFFYTFLQQFDHLKFVLVAILRYLTPVSFSNITFIYLSVLHFTLLLLISSYTFSLPFSVIAFLFVIFCVFIFSFCSISYDCFLYDVFVFFYLERYFLYFTSLFYIFYFFFFFFFFSHPCNIKFSVSHLSFVEGVQVQLVFPKMQNLGACWQQVMLSNRISFIHFSFDPPRSFKLKSVPPRQNWVGPTRWT